MGRMQPDDQEQRWIKQHTQEQVQVLPGRASKGDGPVNANSPAVRGTLQVCKMQCLGHMGALVASHK